VINSGGIRIVPHGRSRVIQRIAGGCRSAIDREDRNSAANLYESARQSIRWREDESTEVPFIVNSG
jgi:hypothetical protein